MSILSNLLKNFLELNNCFLCDMSIPTELGFCNFCQQILPWISNIKNRCNKCQKELSFQEKLICNFCKENFNNFNKIFAIFSYQDPIKKLILDLKFRKKLQYAKFLGNILSNFVLNNWYKNKNLPKIIIPVPLHIDRLRYRGFNQAIELGKNLIRTKKIIMNNNYCIRTKNTVNQASLLKTKRNINIKHAFEAKQIPYNHIAILDDVVTTGGTINSLCNAIVKRNPNIIIDVWCICRA